MINFNTAEQLPNKNCIQTPNINEERYDNMDAIKPTIAIDEFAGHTFDEIRFAKSLKDSVDDFFKVLSGDKSKVRNAKAAMLELIAETDKSERSENNA